MSSDSVTPAEKRGKNSGLGRLCGLVLGLTLSITSTAVCHASSGSPGLQAQQKDPGLNPGWLWIDRGRDLWNGSAETGLPTAARTSGTGGRCVACHGELERQAGVAPRFPRWDASSQRPMRLTDQIQICRRRVDATATAVDDDTLALAMALNAVSAGLVVQPEAAAALTSWLAKGQALWNTRMGQLNLSCAQCHDQRAGQKLGGTRIPAGHDTGYPLYRLQWQGPGTLERRIRGCMSGVRAEPFKPGSDEMLALEVFVRQRSAGLRLEAAGLRP